MQQQMPWIGAIGRPLKKHALDEMKLCKTKAHACRLAVIYSGHCQDVLAGRLGVTAGYLSMLLSGKRRWTDEIQFRFVHITGSLAPVQWDCSRIGGEYWGDVRNEALAALDAERERLLREAA